MNKVRIEILLEILRRENAISVPDFSDAQDLLETGKDPIAELMKLDRLKRPDLVYAAMQYNNAPPVDLDSVEIDLDLSRLFGQDLMKTLQFVPIYKFANGQYIVGAVYPNNPSLRQVLRVVLQDDYQLVQIDKDKLESFLNVYQATQATKSALKSIQSDVNIATSGRKDISSDVANAPAVRFIDSVLEEAVKVGASDVHIEPSEKSVLVT